MALIEYKVSYDGSAVTVVQDVQEIGPGDHIRIVANDPGLLIRFPHISPVAEIAPGIIHPLPVSTEGATGSKLMAFAVKTSNNDAPVLDLTGFGSRRTFPFECGWLDAAGTFIPWLGDGGTLPSGGGHRP